MAPIDTRLYDLLGVAPDASSAEIKKAYHNLVRKEHPDKKPEAEREAASIRFREVQEAYDILREPESRAIYDERGFDNVNGSSGPNGHFDMDDIFAQMFGGGMGMGGPPGKHPSRRSPKQQNVEHEYPVTLEDLYKGKTTKLKGVRNKICPHCSGSGCRTNHKPSKCSSCDGSGTKTASMMVGPGMYTQQQVECPSCSGSGQNIREKDRCKKCKGKKVVDEVKVMEVYIDRGMQDGEVITLKGQADEVPGGQAGDVVITLQQKEHDIFERLGADLTATLRVTLAEALTGFSRVVLRHLDGRLLRYTSPVGKVLKPGQVLLIKGEGMPLGRRRDGHGDLYLTLEVVFPEDNFLSEKAEFAKLAILLPQVVVRGQGIEIQSSESIEEDIVAIPGNMDDFGGEEAQARANGDWEDESDGEREGDPGVQCNQQ